MEELEIPSRNLNGNRHIFEDKRLPKLPSRTDTFRSTIPVVNSRLEALAIKFKATICIASKAVGKVNGVSKMSRLVPVKIKYDSDSLLEAFTLILDDVVGRRITDAVVVYPVSTRTAYAVPHTLNEILELWLQLMEILDQLALRGRTVVVLAAGNHRVRSKAHRHLSSTPSAKSRSSTTEVES